VFVAWTVHLHHNGHVLAFVLDIIKVPKVRYPLVLLKTITDIMFQSHTGEALTQAFHGFINKVRCTPYPYMKLLTISVSTDNASVNDVIIAAVAQIRLAGYGIPPSPNLHIRCVCHVVNLVVQAILAVLGEADNPDAVDYYTLNKEQPLHLDIDPDPDQIELDSEEFQDEVDDETTPEENIMLEEEEKLKATESPLSKVCIAHVKFSYSAC
jgi:hypothetical protein